MIRNSGEFPFSWSQRRQEMWNACRRQYFLHYYAARGGHDADAPPELRRIHEMRSLIPAHTYVRRTVSTEFRRIFYAPHEEEDPEYSDGTDNLAGRAIRRFRMEFRRMLAGEFRIDHGHPMLTELYYGATPPEKLRGEIEHNLHRAFAALESGVVPLLSTIRFLFRRPIASPLAVYAGELRCHVAPIAAFLENGILCLIENSGSDSTVLLHKYHAANELHLPPDRVRSLELVPEEGVLRSCGESLNISQTLREIRDGAADMSRAIRPDGTVHSDDFPRTQTNCPGCRFRGFCS